MKKIKVTTLKGKMGIEKINTERFFDEKFS